MSRRVTLVVDQAEDLFFLALCEIERPDRRLDPNQMAAIRSLAEKIDFQVGETAGNDRCVSMVDEALATFETHHQEMRRGVYVDISQRPRCESPKCERVKNHPGRCWPR